MPQPATAPLSQDEPIINPAEKAANEAPQVSPEKAKFNKAVESGNIDNVRSIIKDARYNAEEALKKLGLDESDLSPAFVADEPNARNIAAGVKTAEDTAKKQLAVAESTAITTVETAMGKTPAAVETPQPAVVEAPKPAEAPVLKNEMAEQQKFEAEESMKEELEAMHTFAQQHGLHLDATTLLAPEKELANLEPVERTYLAVLNAKYHAGDASHAHAEALMAVAAESDPAKKKELSAHAFELSEVSNLKEKAATILNAQYMALPEIAAMLGEPTGNSFGGESFAGQSAESSDTPRTGGPKGPRGPDGPKGPEGPEGSLEQLVGTLRQLFDRYVSALNDPEALKALRKEVMKFAASVHPDRQKDARLSALSARANQLLDSFKDPSKMEGKNREQFLAALAAFEMAPKATSDTGGSFLGANWNEEPAVAALQTGEQPPTGLTTSRTRGGSGISESTGGGSNPGVTKIETLKPVDGGKVEPTAVDSWLSRQLKAVGGFIGRGDGGGGGGDRH